MNKTKMAFLVSAAIVTAACSTTPKSSTELAQDMVKAQQIRDKAAEERTERQQARMKAEIARVPEWAMQTPPPDEEGVYAVGMGGSDSLRLSIRKAVLDGEYGLARATNQMVSGSERSYSKDNNGHAEHEEYTGLIDSLVQSVPVVGIETVNQETQPVGGVFRTYVLLKLPYKELNRALQTREAKSQDETVKEAFAELSARLDKAEKKAAIEATPPRLSKAVTSAGTSTQNPDTEKMPDPTKVLQSIVPPIQPALNDAVH